MGFAFSVLLAVACFCPGSNPLPWRMQWLQFAMGLCLAVHIGGREEEGGV